MDHLIITQLIQDLEKGRNSVHLIRDLLNQRGESSAAHGHQDCYYKGLDDHSRMALAALDSALSVLRFSDYSTLEDTKSGNSMSHDFAPGVTTPKKDRRGCYKRRRNVESEVVETSTLTDDGFAWRKYGQKVILHTNHPRNYYRCTHKIGQGCQATKQVQQISENPTRYRIIYHGQHTCKSTIKNPPIFLDSITPENPDSSVYLSFHTSTPSAKYGLSPATPSNFFFSNSASSDMVKQEYGPIKEETQSEPSDHHHHQYNSSPSSPDPTTTTPRSEISSGEVYSSVASPHGLEMGDDYYSHMLLSEPLDFEKVLQGLYSA